jgi:hypothetical protein
LGLILGSRFEVSENRKGSYRINSSDLVIIIAILAISTGMILLRLYRSGQSSQVPEAFVYHHGQLLMRLNMDKNGVRSLPGTNMKIEIKDRQIRVSESDCPKTLCVRKGWIRMSGDVIVCVPNKVLIEIRSKTGDFLDAVAN